MKLKSKKKLLREILIIFVSFLVILLFNFLLPRLLPGDPVSNLIGIDLEYIPKEQYDFYYKSLGLDKNIFEQFFIYLGSLFNGTLGYSYQYNSNVSNLIGEYLPATLQITLPAFLISSIIALSLGLYLAYKKNTPKDRIVMGLTIGINSFPSFLIGILLLIIFAFSLNWFPTNGLSSYSTNIPFLDRLWHLVLPVTALVLVLTPSKVLQVRNSASEEMKEKYVLYLKTSGVKYHTLMYKHVLSNSFQPYLTMIGLTFASSFSGSIIIENIFSIKGMGYLLVKAIRDLDYPTIQGCLFVTSLILLGSILLIDLLCYFLDPKLRRKENV